MSGEAFGMKPSPDGSHDNTDPQDPFQSVEWERYAAHARATLTPMLKDSAVGVVMAGDHDPDPKQAMELGMMLLMDKPIILIRDPGVEIPVRLLRAADEVLEGPVGRPGFAEELGALVERL